MIENRMQAKMSIKSVMGMLTKPGGDSSLKGDRRRNIKEKGYIAIAVCIGTGALPTKRIYMCWSRFDCMS